MPQAPASYKEAMLSPHADQWRAAVNEHLAGHARLHTFEEIIIPSHRRAIPGKWVFALKTSPTGQIDRFKARFVIQGFRQRQGLDFTEVFSPTIRSEQIRLALALAAEWMGRSRRSVNSKMSVQIAKADVSDAYLTAPLPDDENVLFELPAGYTPTLHAPAGHRVVARSIKAQMGLKQSGRVWHSHFHSILLAQNFAQCNSAPCLYLRPHAGGIVLVGLFVDDLLLINHSTDSSALEDLINKELSAYLKIKYSPDLDKFLGAEFNITEDGIRMHLSSYIKSIVERFDEEDSSSAPTPALASPDSSANAADEAFLLRVDKLTYQSITGAAMFCQTTCRPDIAHAVNLLSRRMSQPRVCDLRAARRVLRYLRDTAGLGLLFPFDSHPTLSGLHAFADSDWANDRVERRSTSGYIALYNGAPISWHSGLQPVIALSTCEAEYVSLCDCCREIAYIRQLLAFLQCAPIRATPIYEDNQGTIDLVHNPVHHRRTKHVDVKYHYIRQAEAAGVVLVHKVPTLDNRADLFTKPLSGSLFATHVSALLHSPR
jgi:hypothetical protein